MKDLIFWVGIALLISCEAGGQKRKEGPYLEAKTVVNEFYSWYINDIYKDTYAGFLVPHIKKVKDQTYVFDEKELSRKLNTIPYLTTNYKNHLMNKMRLCNEEISKLRWESEPESQFNSKNCDYLWFDNWVGGQGEDIDGFRISDESIQQATFKVTVEVMTGKSVFTKAIVTVVKEDNSFLIDDIVLDWD